MVALTATQSRHQPRFVVIVVSCSLTHMDMAIEIWGTVVMERMMNFEGGIATPL